MLASAYAVNAVAEGRVRRRPADPVRNAPAPAAANPPAPPAPVAAPPAAAPSPPPAPEPAPMSAEAAGATPASLFALRAQAAAIIIDDDSLAETNGMHVLVACMYGVFSLI